MPCARNFTPSSLVASSKKTFQNSSPMMRRLRSGSVTPASSVEVAVLGVDVHEVDVELVAEGAHDLLGLVEAQHAVVDEDARELVADRAVQQRGDDAGVHAAGQAADDASRRRPARGCVSTASSMMLTIVHSGGMPAMSCRKRADDVLAVLGVRDLGVELRRVELARRVLHRGDRVVRGARRDREARRAPCPRCRGGSSRPARSRARPSSSSHDGSVTVELGEAVLADVGLGDLAAEVQRHLLDAVAEAQDRDAELEHAPGPCAARPRRTRSPDRRRG